MCELERELVRELVLELVRKLAVSDNIYKNTISWRPWKSIEKQLKTDRMKNNKNTCKRTRRDLKNFLED